MKATARTLSTAGTSVIAETPTTIWMLWIVGRSTKEGKPFAVETLRTEEMSTIDISGTLRIDQQQATAGEVINSYQTYQEHHRQASAAGNSRDVSNSRDASNSNQTYQEHHRQASAAGSSRGVCNRRQGRDQQKPCIPGK
jgi:hypothetical protein